MLIRSRSRSPQVALRRALTVAAATSLVIVSGAVAANLTAAAATTATRNDPQSIAIAAAEQSGEPEVIDSQTTGHSLTEALPDGTLRTSYSVTVDRVQRDGDWLDVDPSLHANADGTFSPRVAAAGLKLSGGGTHPLATMTVNGKELSLTWPSALPTPVITDDAATYPSVLPDTDLVVTASTQGGFSEVLVVKTEAAAHNPALSTITLGSSATGVTLSADAGGNLTGADNAGETVFHAAAPMMWDSGDDGNATAPRFQRSETAEPSAADDEPTTAEDPIEAPPTGAQVAPVEVDLSASGAIALSPDVALLTGDETNYPVYIDPTWVSNTTGSQTVDAWAWAQQANPNTSWYKDTSNGNPAVGYQGWESAYSGKNNSFWQFNIGDYTNLSVRSATFEAKQTYTGSFDCSLKRRINACDSGAISSSTTWNHQPEIKSGLDHADITGCTGSNSLATFDVKEAIVNDTNQVVAFRLQADDTSDKYSYRRFTGSGAKLVIEYDRAPYEPTSLLIQPAPQNPAGDCRTQVGWLKNNSGDPVTLSANLNDPDLAATDQNVTGRFHLWVYDPLNGNSISDVIAPTTSAGTSSPTTVAARRSIDVPVAKLKNGRQYGWDVYANDTVMNSPISDHCYFWYDSAVPITQPATSNDFKLSGSTKHVNEAGAITVKATDPDPSDGSYSGIVSFQYSFTSESTMTMSKAATVSGNTGTATISYTPTSWGMNYLYVRGVDKAGNPGNTSIYKFYVPEDPNAQPRPGDVDGKPAGDGSPDILAANASTKNLELYSASPGSAYGSTPENTPKVASSAANAPEGSGTWGNTLIAHRASSTAFLDDLWAKKPGSPGLTYYKNNANTQGGISGYGNLYYTTENNVPAVGRPSCDATKTTCDAYTADWSGVTQLVAPGDVNGDGNADLITVEGNTAWFFHGGNTNGELLDPRLLTANLGPLRLIAPGNNDGTEAIETGSDCDTGKTVPVSSTTPSDMIPAPKAIPDLWGLASTADGPIMSRSLHVSGYGCKETPLGDHNDIITLGPAKQSTSTTGWGTTSRRLVATPGDGAGANGLPDLYTIVHNNTTNRDELWCNEGTANADATGPHLSGRRIVDEGTSLNWANITNVA